MRKHRGGFWPFSSNTEEKTAVSETTSGEPQESSTGFFAGLFGKKNVPEEEPTNPVEEIPQGPSLPKSVQAGGSKRRTKTRKHRTLRKKNRSHRRSRTQKK